MPRLYQPCRRTQSCALTAIAIAFALLALPREAAAAAISSDDILRVLSLRDYNTRVVVGGVTLLGLAAGVIGVFALLRKRSLMADAVAHATLPGIAGAFLIAAALGYSGRSLGVLLSGATIAGLIGMAAVLGIRHTSRIKDDAALGIVLSVFFGLGIALLGIVQQSQAGNAAGIDRFLLGQAAAMASNREWLISIPFGEFGSFDLPVSILIALACAGLCLLLYKEFALICFDSEYAVSRGLPVLMLDTLMMTAIVVVTVVGLEAVGLVLIIGLLIIPPAAARFWTDRLGPMVIMAAVIGAVSGFSGAIASAIFPRTPTGPIIVLVCAGFFVVSMLAGPERGVVALLMRRFRLRRRTALQHLLRELYEQHERAATAPRATDDDRAVTVDTLLQRRSWSRLALMRLLKRAERDGLLTVRSGRVQLTETGLREAAHVVRNHRLWEQFLVRYADIAPSHVDRDADDIEHVLGEPMVRELEQLLEANHRMPPSPHRL